MKKEVLIGGIIAIAVVIIWLYQRGKSNLKTGDSVDVVSGGSASLICFDEIRGEMPYSFNTIDWNIQWNQSQFISDDWASGTETIEGEDQRNKGLSFFKGMNIAISQRTFGLYKDLAYQYATSPNALRLEDIQQGELICQSQRMVIV